MNDTYSKVMLTIIAAALCVNAFLNMNIVNPALASGDVIHKIAICDKHGDCASLTGAFGKMGLRVHNTGK